MKYKIEKDLDRNYFVISEYETADNNYELAIVSENKIDGFLPVLWNKINGDNIFKYEISGKVNLTNKFPHQTLKKKHIISLVNDIIRSIESAENYLLSPKSILLIPDLIFYVADKANFCYLPSYEQDLTSSFSKLVKWMLSRVDYKDSESISLIYGLNSKIEKDNINIYEANEFLQKQIKEKPYNDFVNQDKKKEISIAAQRFYEDGQFAKKSEVTKSSSDENSKEQDKEIKSKRKNTLICMLFIMLFISSSVYFLSNGASVLKIIASALVCVFLCAYCFDKQLVLIKKIKSTLDKIKNSGECIDDINWNNIY